MRAAEDNRSFFEARRSDAELPLWSDRHEDICRAYVRGSWYAYQIEEWRREFSSDNLFFCILERDLANDRGKLELLQRLMGFLDLATTGVEFKLDVPNVSAPCPKVYFPTTHETVWSRGTGNVVIEPPDILIEYGKARRIVRRPSAELRSFFETMAHEMTPGLSAEARQFLRQKYFAQVGDQISDLVADDVNALWYK